MRDSIFEKQSIIGLAHHLYVIATKIVLTRYDQDLSLISYTISFIVVCVAFFVLEINHRFSLIDILACIFSFLKYSHPSVIHCVEKCYNH